MAALTKDVLRSLAAFKSSGSPVVSLYLDVDGHRYVRARDYEAQLDALLRRVGATPAGPAAERSGATLVALRARSQTAGPAAHDLTKIEGFVKEGIDRSGVRGIAIFSCAPDGLWEVIELPVPVHNRLTVNAAPQVRQLEAVLDENERFGVLLVDRQRARLFVFELGVLVERSELFDELPRHEDDKGEWDRDHVHDHQATAARAHLRRAAQVAFEVDRAQPFDHLILGGPSEVVADLEREMHSYLADRIAARISVAVGAREEDIRQAALAVEVDVNRRQADRLVEKVREKIGTGAAVAGLNPVLGALGEHRIESLLVSDGFAVPGWHCGTCDRLCSVGPRCASCGAAMDKVEDVVDEAIAMALQQRARVTTCTSSADLDVMGQIAALLRF